MSIEPGQVIDEKYRVVKLLGKGGMGAVYLAEHLVIGRKVAVKVLLGSVAGNETAVARFEREAQAAGRIGSDHILEIYDFGSLPDGSRYMVCEFLEGETLADRLDREQRLSVSAIVPLARQLLMGLGAAHQAGVVHRDLKPENVFILRQKAGLVDFVKIIDFGISKFQPLSAGEGMQMTATGIVVGTPCYLSPEQARGSRDADARSDLYAIGVILYEAITGKLPFESQNVNDLLFKIVLESPIPVREAAPDVDADFAALIEIAMARDPEHRFQTAGAFIDALDRWANDHGVAISGPSFVPRADTGNAAIARSAGLALPAAGSTRSLAPTPGTWADSKISVAAFQPQRRSKGLVVAGAVLGFLLVGGVSFALLQGKAPPPDGTTASGAPVVSTSSAADQVPKAAPVEPPPPPVVPPAPAAAPTNDPSTLLEPPPAGSPTAAAPAAPIVRRPPPQRPPASGATATSPKKAATATAAPAAATGASKRRRDYGY